MTTDCIVPKLNVVCAGDPTEQGTAQGSRLADAIQQAADTLHDLEAFRLRRPWWTPYLFFVRLAELRAERALRAALRSNLPHAWDRLQAVSTASRVTLGRLALLNALEPVLSDLSGCITGLEAGCSAVAVGAHRSGGHGALLAHNFDYLPIIQPLYCLRDECPTGGYRSLQFSIAPLIGPVDGINEHGLAVTFNYAYTTDPALPAPTISMLLGEVLARCRTVQEAARRLVDSRRWGSGLIMLADASGATASVELTPTQHHVRTGSPGNVLTHANRVSGDPTSAVQLGAAAVYGRRSPLVLRGRRVHESSECREQSLARLQQVATPLDPDGVARQMADHGPSGIPSALTLCMHSSYWHTTACVQLLPLTRSLRVSYSTACQASYVDFSINRSSAGWRGLDD